MKVTFLLLVRHIVAECGSCYLSQVVSDIFTRWVNNSLSISNCTHLSVNALSESVPVFISCVIFVFVPAVDMCNNVCEICVGLQVHRSNVEHSNRKGRKFVIGETHLIV